MKPIKEKNVGEKISEGLFDMMKEFVVDNYIQSSSGSVDISNTQSLDKRE